MNCEANSKRFNFRRQNQTAKAAKSLLAAQNALRAFNVLDFKFESSDCILILELLFGVKRKLQASRRENSHVNSNYRLVTTGNNQTTTTTTMHYSQCKLPAPRD